MKKKRIDRTFDGVKLTDKQLDCVVGGVNLPPKEAAARAGLLSAKAVSKPIFRR